MFITCSERVQNIFRIALNLRINLSGEKPEGYYFIRLGLYWVGGTKSWLFDWPLFIGREGMVDVWRCK